MTRQGWLLTLLGAAVALFAFTKTKQGAAAVIRVTDWVMPAAGQKYAAAFAAAEKKYGLPRNILARMAQQESSYKPDVISPAGAVGLMQIVPKWHPGVNPNDPLASIDYAGKYLASLFRQTGTWPLALAAYNWGIGNLKTYGMAKAPKETREYVAAITRDVGLT